MSIVVCPNCSAKNRVDERRADRMQPVCGRCGAPLPVSEKSAGGMPVVISDGNFGEFLEEAGERPVLVDCWAPWCGPCRMMAPIIEQLAAEGGGRYVVGKLNTDENPRTAARFNISAIPTLLIFRRGQLVDQIVGLQPKQAIEARLAGAAAAA